MLQIVLVLLDMICLVVHIFDIQTYFCKFPHTPYLNKNETQVEKGILKQSLPIIITYSFIHINFEFVEDLVLFRRSNLFVR